MYDLQTIIEHVHPIATHIVHDQPIQQILTDSRILTSSAGAAFFAMRTTTGDGHKYIQHLYDHGVRTFFISAPIAPYITQCPAANLIQVQDTLRTLQHIAALWRMHFDYPVIGITGSNGKTVVKEFLYHLLSPVYHIVRSPKSFNSQLGVPLSIFKMEEGYDMAIFEAGISMPMEMARLELIIRPTIGILTNIGSAHQENFISIAQKTEEKLQLFHESEYFIYNADDEDLVRSVAMSQRASCAIGWSYVRGVAPIYVETKRGESHTHLRAHMADGAVYEAEIPFIDDASLQNATHCLCLVGLLPLSTEERKQVLSRFSTLEAIEMRLEVKEGLEGNTLINDAYNNDINSLRIALDYQRLRCNAGGQQGVIILSDILQSSLLPRILYRQVSDLLDEYPLALVIGVGEELCNYQNYFQREGRRALFYETTDALLEEDILTTLRQSTILVKGARQFQFERIVQMLSRQVHETILEIDLEAVVSNLKRYQSLLPEGTQMIVMAKAQGYGIGAYELAKALEQQSIAALAVAVADEGKELRARGILTPIIVMNPEPEAFDTMIRYRLEPEIYNSRLLQQFAYHVERQGLEHYPVHVELDTGMHRTGFSTDKVELDDLLGTLSEVGHLIKVKSFFTHLAAADSEDMRPFTEQQFTLFDCATEYLSKGLHYRPLRHVLNTAGMERYADHAYDMVRLGIGLYGVSATGTLTLQPVVKLRTTLLQIKKIPKGETIGYGRCGRLSQEGEIGIIPIGYADGYDRRFSCGVGKVLIRGKLCPIVGNICMDTCMVDLTALKGEVQEGEEVTIFGAPGVQLENLAERIGTIPYEIISKLSPRIKRIYYR